MNKSNGKTTMDDIRTAFTNYEPTGEHGSKHFAVILPIIKSNNGDLCLAYEVRATGLDRQPGEVCFPGGMIEDGETPRLCALRETEEELGIKPEAVEIITEIDSIYTGGGSQIFCFVGIIDEADFEDMKPNETEVAEVFTVEINTLLETEPEMYFSAMKQEADPDFPYDRVSSGKVYPWRNGKVSVPVYDIQDAKADHRIIWGLTGRMTKQFLEILKCMD